VALGLALFLGWPGPGGEPPGSASSPAERSPLPLEHPRSPPLAPAPPRAPVPPTGTSGDALAQALGEERVVLPSSVRVDRIEQDRAWVCAGEAMGLSAHLGGVPEPGAVFRWVWPTAEGRAELHPGPTLQWKAPPEAGTYPVRFQVCRDLGGRRVGVLAERELELDVRPCGAEAGQRQGPLRIGVTQQGPGTFTFQALYQGEEPISAYTWDVGDGSRSPTSGPRLAHTYELSGLGAQEPRSFTVKLQARLEHGRLLEATTFVLTRGQPAPSALPAAELQVSRWRPLAQGAGWRSDVVVRAPDGTDLAWERLERVSVPWEGEALIDSRAWRERVSVEEDLGHGGFRGHVTVSPAEAGPDIKQILDFLHGHDAAGQEVVVSWSPFKREPPADSPRAPGPPPVKP
jgi:hypothetical protein